MRISHVVLLVGLSASCLAQSSNSSSALALLQRVSQHYADAKSYRINAIEETNTVGELTRNWQKTILSAIEDEGKHRFEGRSDSGSAMRVSDGTSEWVIHFEEHAYTKKSISELDAKHIVGMPEFALLRASALRKALSGMSDQYQSAEFLTDTSLAINNKHIPCRVIHLSTKDRRRKSDSTLDMTLWIDKSREIILKSQESSDTYMLIGSAHIPRKVTTVITYSVVELNPILSATVFSFIPPADAQLLDEFPSPLSGGMSLAGRTLPNFKVKNTGGTSVTLDSFRGKPILIDLWATWCAPCVEALPKLNQIYQETKDKGLVFLSLDRDEDPETALNYLSQNGYRWQNFHDDGDAAKFLGESGIPRALLVDAQGKILFDKLAFDADELRNEIGKLGPEYTSVVKKSDCTPCISSK